MRLDVRVPVLLPAVALPARLALEGLQAHVLVHVLLEIFSFKELLVTAAGQVGENNNNNGNMIIALARSKCATLKLRLTESRRTDGRWASAGASSGVCSGLKLGGRLCRKYCIDTLILLWVYTYVFWLVCSFKKGKHGDDALV